MILFLNILPVVLGLATAIMAYLATKEMDGVKKVKCLLSYGVMYILTLMVLNAATPSYLPKGEIRRTMPPTFEQKEFEVKDDLLKPMSGEERDFRREELYKERLPFLKETVDKQN